MAYHKTVSKRSRRPLRPTWQGGRTPKRRPLARTAPLYGSGGTPRITASGSERKPADWGIPATRSSKEFEQRIGSWGWTRRTSTFSLLWIYGGTASLKSHRYRGSRREPSERREVSAGLRGYSSGNRTVKFTG